MASKPMDNAALVANDEMDTHQGQYSRHPPGYPTGAPMNYSGQAPVGCYNPPPVGINSSQHTSIQMHSAQPQPMVIMESRSEPQTVCSLVMSTLNTIFCFAWPLGLMAIALSWQARLQVLDRKFTHARHTLTVSWIINGMSFLFGLAIWGILIWLFSLMNSSSRAYGYGY